MRARVLPFLAATAVLSGSFAYGRPVWADDPAPAAPKAAPAAAISLGFQAVPASVLPAEVRAQASIPDGAGVIAVQVTPGGPADVAGMKQFDVILKIAGKELPPTAGVDADKPETVAAYVESVAKLTAGTAVGTKVEVVVQRDGAPVTVVLTAAIERGYLGFTPSPVALVSAKRRAKLGVKAETGIVVVKVTAGSPAEKAGLKVGDLLVKFAGQDVPPTKDVTRKNPESGRAFASAFGRIAATTHPGTEVELVVERDGKPVTVKAVAVDLATIQKISAAAGPGDDDGDDDEEDEGPEGPEKGEGPGMAPDKAPAPK